MTSDAPVPGPPRASDAERERAVEVLRAAAGDGRLTLEELAERVEGALVAKTRETLEMGGNDIKIEGPPPQPGAPVVRVRAFSLMGGTDVRTKAPRRSTPSSGDAPSLGRPG